MSFPMDYAVLGGLCRARQRIENEFHPENTCNFCNFGRSPWTRSCSAACSNPLTARREQVMTWHALLKHDLIAEFDLDHVKLVGQRFS